ncbi:MAG: hypothetical protein ABSB86_12430 [Bryobacteraceae bacterium]
MSLALVLAVGMAATRLVAPNEGWFADPAFHLETQGFFGTTVLESTGTWLEGVDRHTYWILPLYPLAVAPLFRAFGFGLYTMRALSIFWALTALSAFYLLMLSQAGRSIALLATLLLGVDFHFLVGAGVGRMDMMCAALGYSALATYMVLRERSLRAAILASSTLAVAGCLTHPCGILAVCGLVFLAFRFDRERLTWSVLSLAALPCAVGLAAYGAYALQDWPSYVRQLTGNVSGVAGEATGSTRFDGLTHPLSALRRELLIRYMSPFNGDSWKNPYRTQLVILSLYWGGVIVALLDRRIRSQKAARLLLALTGIYFVIMWLFEGLKLRVYMVHTLPLFAGLGALWIWNWTEGRRSMRASVVAIILCIQFLALGVGVHKNQYHNEHLPAAAYMLEHGHPGSLIMASGQFAFEFGYDGRLIDDVRLGYFTGKKPEFFVRDVWYGEWLDHAKTRDPEIYKHVSTTLAARYREVFRNPGFIIYQQR